MSQKMLTRVNNNNNKWYTKTKTHDMISWDKPHDFVGRSAIWKISRTNVLSVLKKIRNLIKWDNSLQTTSHGILLSAKHCLRISAVQYSTVEKNNIKSRDVLIWKKMPWQNIDSTWLSQKINKQPAYFTAERIHRSCPPLTQWLSNILHQLRLPKKLRSTNTADMTNNKIPPLPLPLVLFLFFFSLHSHSCGRKSH